MIAHCSYLLAISYLAVDVSSAGQDHQLNNTSFDNLMRFAPLLVQNKSLQKLSETLNFYFQNISYNEIFEKMQKSTENKSDDNVRLINIDRFEDSSKEMNESNVLNTTTPIRVNSSHEKESKDIHTDELISEYIRIMEERHRGYNPSAKPPIRPQIDNLNRFFYSGADWTLNLLPTLLIIKIAFIAGVVVIVMQYYTTGFKIFHRITILNC